MTFDYENFDDLPEIKGFEMKYARLFIPTPKLAMKAIEHFYASLDDYCKETDQLYQNLERDGNLEAYRLKVHSLKSSSASIGNMTLHVLAKLLDSACRVNDFSRIRTIHPVFMEELALCKETLEEVFTELNNPKAPADPKTVMPLLQTLKFCIYDNDLTIAEDCISELSLYSYPPSVSDDMKELFKLVLDLKNDAALVLIDRIIESVLMLYCEG